MKPNPHKTKKNPSDCSVRLVINYYLKIKLSPSKFLNGQYSEIPLMQTCVAFYFVH